MRNFDRNVPYKAQNKKQNTVNDTEAFCGRRTRARSFRTLHAAKNSFSYTSTLKAEVLNIPYIRIKMLFQQKIFKNVLLPRIALPALHKIIASVKQGSSHLFNEAHRLKVGLSVAIQAVSRNVNSVTCIFYHTFSCEKSGQVVNRQWEIATVQSFKFNLSVTTSAPILAPSTRISRVSMRSFLCNIIFFFIVRDYICELSSERL